MRAIFFLAFYLFSAWIFGQGHAWFIGDGFEADLLLVETRGDLFYKQQGLLFADSVQEVRFLPPVDEHRTLLPEIFYAPQEVRFPLATAQKLPFLNGAGTTGEPFQFYSMGVGINYTVVDSLEVDGKWYTIHQHFFDDGWVGGRPNAIQQHIAVSELGVIYSYGNWLQAHLLLMLWHEDPVKQRVLQKVYAHLELNNDWQEWKKMGSLATTYSFENGAEQLRAAWMDSRNDLELVSATYETIGAEVKANILLKNSSTIAYAFPLYFSIAPSKATIHFQDQNSEWDLLDTHYGAHLKQMSQEVYLAPGDEIRFTYTFPRYFGCGSCTDVTYEGFQVVTSRSFVYWLLQEPETHLGKEYVIYPHRAIRLVE